jgi:uncharacterized protein (PEP-CTERM system associated)
MADLRLRAPAALLALLFAAPQAQAQWRFTPQISVSETFSDNPGLQSRADAHGQWITAFTPSLGVSYTGPRLTLNGSSQWSYYHYSRDDAGTRSNMLQYQGTAKAIVIDELLFVDASAGRAPRSLSAFGPQVNDNPYAVANSNEVNTWSVSPYLRRRFGPTADLTARYTIDEVDAGENAFGSSQSNSIDLRLASGSIFRTLGWGLSYRRQEIDAPGAGSTSSQNALANLSLRVSRTLSLTATGGYDNYEYDEIGGGLTKGSNWSAGFDWTPSSRTRLQLSGGRHFFGNTWDLSAVHRSRRSVWNIQYNDEIVNSRDQFLRSNEADITAMVDAMFRPQIRNPIRRAEAVAAYIQDNGLANALRGYTPYFANRFIRQKGFNAAVVFNGPRADLAFAASDNRRTLLATSDTAPVIPVGGIGRIDDNVHLSNLSAIGNYRITPRSSAQASLTFGRSRSLTTDIVDHNQALRASFTRQLTQTVSSMVEVRHVRGSSDVVGGRKYHENAITAALTMQFKAR